MVKTDAFHEDVVGVGALDLAFWDEFVDEFFCLLELVLSTGSEFDKTLLEELEIIHSLNKNALVHFNFIIKVQAVENKVIKFLVFE